MMMADLDYQRHAHRLAAYGVLEKMRRVTVDFSDWFWMHPKYDRYVNDGLTDNQKFAKMVTAMQSYEIFPVSFERDTKKYKPLTLPEWARLTYLRAIAMRNEQVRHTEDLAIMTGRFPILGDLYAPPKLTTDRRFILPAGPLNHHCQKCAAAFSDEQSLHKHMEDRHPEPKRGLDALFDRVEEPTREDRDEEGHEE
jgi:hypothetical protein